ncbi:HNH endonuclease signature motif containing protein [Arthrobacter sp. H41]|uniref:HNH endonuclease signature motif containing protein n=1 Tax=Arthrobacter sp. H41 TaxID=1312978 RepID=UPI0004B0A6AE|nr:HNH endonuclease signature motif containing protein [Arthrobacter sp. H41]
MEDAGASATVKPGLSGLIGLLSVELLDGPGLTDALAKLGTLIAWAQAGQAEVMHLLEERFQDEMRHNGLAAKAEARGRQGSVPGSPPAGDPAAGNPGATATAACAAGNPAAATPTAACAAGGGASMPRACDATYLRRLRRADEELAASLTATEIACALSLSERTAVALLRTSHALCTDFPDTLLALRRGVITYHHAVEIVEQSDGVPSSARKDYEHCLLAAAPGRTRAQLARVARRERERHHPEAIKGRQVKAAADRRVELIPDKDGMCWLSAYLCAETASGVFGMVTALAKSVQGPDEARTLTQLRADILTDLLTGPVTRPRPGPDTENQVRSTATAGGSNAGTGGGSGSGTGGSSGWSELAGRGPVGAEVLVTMDVHTLLGLTENPAQLEGYGPISPTSARELAAISKHFTPLLVGGEDNALSMGRKARLPSTLLRRWLRFQDETCRFPGCSRGAAHCEVDHSVPWSQGGTTDHGNLAHLCAKHHRFKSITSWNLTSNTAGVLSWTSPTYRTYTTTPANSLTSPSTAASMRDPIDASRKHLRPDPVQDPAEALAADPAPF